MSTPTYDDEGYRRDSQGVRLGKNYRRKHPDVWYYEEDRGLYCLVGTYNSSGDLCTKEFIIPRSQILKYARVAESV